VKTLHKKIYYDAKGKPAEVMLPWHEYQEMAELLGLDLDTTTKNNLRQAKKDRTSGNLQAYQTLGSI